MCFFCVYMSRKSPIFFSFKFYILKSHKISVIFRCIFYCLVIRMFTFISLMTLPYMCLHCTTGAACNTYVLIVVLLCVVTVWPIPVHCNIEHMYRSWQWLDQHLTEYGGGFWALKTGLKCQHFPRVHWKFFFLSALNTIFFPWSTVTNRTFSVVTVTYREGHSEGSWIYMVVNYSIDGVQCGDGQHGSSGVLYKGAVRVRLAWRLQETTLHEGATTGQLQGEALDHDNWYKWFGGTIFFFLSFLGGRVREISTTSDTLVVHWASVSTGECGVRGVGNFLV